MSNIFSCTLDLMFSFSLSTFDIPRFLISVSFGVFTCVCALFLDPLLWCGKYASPPLQLNTERQAGRQTIVYQSLHRGVYAS